MLDVRDLSRIGISSKSSNVFSGNPHDTVELADVRQRIVELFDEDATSTHSFMTDVVEEVVIEQPDECPNGYQMKTRGSPSLSRVSCVCIETLCSLLLCDLICESQHLLGHDRIMDGHQGFVADLGICDAFVTQGGQGLQTSEPCHL